MSGESIDLDQVRAEIEEEAQRQRNGGTFSAERDRELERAFMLFAPRQGHAGALSWTLRGVDSSLRIDPVVPVASGRPAGLVVKKSLRKAMFWYMSWITDQVTGCLSNIGASLHLVEEDLERIHEQLSYVAIDTTPVIERDGSPAANAWWGDVVVRELSRSSGRVLVSACGDGWLVKQLVDNGVDAYGVDPRPGKIQRSQLEGLDVRDDELIVHLSHVAAKRLSGVVLTGTTEGLFLTQRGLLLNRIEQVLEGSGWLMIHGIHPDSMEGDEIPPALDFVGAKPLRPKTWVAVLEERGFRAMMSLSNDGSEYLIVANRTNPAL